MPIVILFSLIIFALLAWYARKHIISTRRDKIFSQALPDHWQKLLINNVPLYTRLPNHLVQHFHGCVQLFLHEKKFIGRGIEVNDEMRLTVAGNACMLLLHQQQRRFPDFKSIIIYPDTYVAAHTKHNGAVEAIENSHRAGESWVRGPIVLSWGDSIRGSLNNRDGHNVILHEFAHKLDEQSGAMNGLPVLHDHAHYSQWSKVLNDEFSSLQYRAVRRKNSVLDEYGTLSPAEFFAVATESFFEKPKQMKKKLPELYEQLSRFYNIDPASWQSK